MPVIRFLYRMHIQKFPDRKSRMSQEGQPCPGVNQAQHHQPVEGEDFPSLLCTGLASPLVLSAILGTTI